MKKQKYLERKRVNSPNPNKYLRLHRGEFGAIFKQKNRNLDFFYPDISNLIITVSKFHKINKNRLLIGLGAESLIKDIFLCLKKFFKVKKVLNILPNFFMYSYYAKLFGVKEIGLKHNILHESLDSKKIIDTLNNKKIKFLILVNPSSPIEKNWKITEIEKILKFCEKKKIIVLLDEVYQLLGSKSFIKKSVNYNNLIILRSFSKAFGSPGIRSGYIISNHFFIKMIESFRLAIELPNDTIIKSHYLLTNFKKVIKKRIIEIKKARAYAHKEFKKRGIKSFNKYLNSVTFLFNTEKEKIYVCNKLEKNKILVNFKYPSPLEKFANITTTHKKNVSYFFKRFDEINNKI